MVSRFIISAAAVLALAACDDAPAEEAAATGAPTAFVQAPRPINPPPETPLPVYNAEVLALGEGVYAEACAACHGANLEGDPDWRSRSEDGLLKPPPHDETGHTWHHGDKLLFEYTKFGGAVIAGDIPGFTSAMPGFEDMLTDAEIWAVLSYIKSTWPPQIQRMQARMSASDAD